MAAPAWDLWSWGHTGHPSRLHPPSSLPTQGSQLPPRHSSDPLPAAPLGGDRGGGPQWPPRCPAQRDIVCPAVGCAPPAPVSWRGRVEALLKSPFMPGARRPHRPGERLGTQSLFHGVGKGEGEPRSGPAAPRGCRPTPRHSVARHGMAWHGPWELGAAPYAWHKAPQSATQRARGVCPCPQLLSIPIPAALGTQGAPHPIAPCPHRGARASPYSLHHPPAPALVLAGVLAIGAVVEEGVHGGFLGRRDHG